ncbi:MLO-like protein 7 isoform X2 [Brachypodium distachyon]|uniref:MLO-like protein n=1 Tax=Brachypodium distachyon TaxID=15368 RepID=A0A2K2CLC4_BRADI|nr:MLO-like protein 7 isoform X2 [Brachypodium distachyon]PNT62823.1 hypothetical protein BRADI_4g08741v3 [Brachypodium distachyon]|eukprot:XP_024319424.1 MLO-like protein 7 isoform X2 [Brachypodium distachyon]
MGGGAAGASNKPLGLEVTPTWAVAAICGVMIGISLTLDAGLHHATKWLRKRRSLALFDALDTMKSELIALGFVSLLLTFLGFFMPFVCVPLGAASTMLPCECTEQLAKHPPPLNSCRQGMVPLVPPEALHQLHLFLFYLALLHVAFKLLTLYLARAKISKWKEWEKEARSASNDLLHQPSNLRLSHQTTFVMRLTKNWSKSTVLLYIVSFFRQFFNSVEMTDYVQLRHGFMTAHLSPGTNFDFGAKIQKSLSADLKAISSCSSPLWASALVMLLINVRGWDGMFWLSILRVVVIFLVGTELQTIITARIDMDKLSDEHFWFRKPRLLLHLIILASFQNAFQISHFLWISVYFGLMSCFHQGHLGKVVAGVCLSGLLQFICSYITMPLYGLASQIKRTVLDVERGQEDGADAKTATSTANVIETIIGPVEKVPIIPALRRCKSAGYASEGLIV